MVLRSALGQLRRALVHGSLALALSMVWSVSSAPLAAAQSASRPCDIYAAGGTPCVAAHSTVRALFATYNGSLYQVRRSSDGATSNIGLVSAGGIANAAAQDSFCANTTCTIQRIFDQSGRGNDLTIQQGCTGGCVRGNTPDQPAVASALPITIGGQKAYGIDIEPGQGYRHPAPSSGVATGSQPEGMYMVTSGTHVNGGCCFDYGNAEANIADTGNGHMDALNFASECWFGGCNGSGPWVQGDLENGLFQGTNGTNTANAGNKTAFVTAILKNNGTSQWALRGGNSQSGGLTTWFSGALPPGGYSPMRKEGSIILGTGGDGSNLSLGSFFEGAMTSGFPSDATENSVQSNVVAAGYAMSAARSGPIRSRVNTNKCVDLRNASATRGTPVQIFDCNGVAAAQTWTIASNGTVTIGGGCLDITGANSANGTLIEWWTCNGGANQQWRVQSGQLVNPATSKCLDDPASNVTNGTQLVLWTCNGGTNQQWITP